MSAVAILGKKIGMTQIYDKEGRAVPVTVVEAGPCVVLAVRTPDRDGYEAVQLGFDDMKIKRASKALIGHCAKAGSPPKRFIREFRSPGVSSEYKVGDIITVDIFEDRNVRYVDVVGISKGKGFAGVMKRYGFGGQPDSHGTERKHRSPGSIGSHASEAGHGGGLKKGKRMAGHMGAVRVTVRNQELVGVVKEENLLLIKGAVPGPAGGYVFVRSSKTKQ